MGERGLKTSYVLQLGRNYSNEEALNEGLRSFYETGFAAEDIEILNTISWPYFYRWKPEEMEQGAVWNVFDLQGKRRTWFAGASVSFESIRGVMEYNKLLLRQMIKPSEQPKPSVHKNAYSWRRYQLDKMRWIFDEIQQKLLYQA